MIKRIKALLLALAAFISLGACKENENIENQSPEPKISNSIEGPVPRESVEFITEPEEKEPVFIEPAITKIWSLDSEPVQNELAKIENGEPFQFTYVTGFWGQNGIGSCYGIMGNYFKQIVIDGKKCLVYANDESKILVSDYDFLGMPYYLFGYDEGSGGKDPNSAYSGWVLPTYNYIDEKDPYSGRRLYTYNLYDYENFCPLLEDCTPDSEFFTYGPDFYGMKGPLNPFYLKVLAQEYNGCDDINAATGYVVIIEKDGIKYLVDANDFTKIYCQGFTGIDTVGDELIVKDYRDDNNSGTEYHVKAEDIKPTYSGVLTKFRGR